MWFMGIDQIMHFLLPTISLTLISFAGYTRYARAGLLEVLHDPAHVAVAAVEQRNRALAREGLDDMKGAYLDYRTAIKLEPTFELAQAQLTRFTVVRR